MRELGGVFGVAVLSSVFSRPGVYNSPTVFVHGFKAAVWVAVAFTAIGVLAAAATAARPKTFGATACEVEPEALLAALG
jgi:hypothetical protein